MQVCFNAAEFNKKSLEVIESYRQAACVFHHQSFEMIYSLDKSWESLEERLNRASQPTDYWEIAQALTTLEVNLDDFNIPYLHPNNIYFLGNKVQVVHHGMKEILSPYQKTEDDLLREYKALVFYCLYPKYQFDDLIHGLPTIRKKEAKLLHSLGSFEEIIQVIDEIYQSKMNHFKDQSIRMSKFKFGLILSILFLLIFGVGYLGYYHSLAYSTEIPVKIKVETALSNFYKGDYKKVIKSLGNLPYESMTDGTQKLVSESVILDADLMELSKLYFLSKVRDGNKPLIAFFVAYARGDKDMFRLAKKTHFKQLSVMAYQKKLKQVQKKKNHQEEEKELKEKIDDLRNHVYEDFKQMGAIGENIFYSAIMIDGYEQIEKDVAEGKSGDENDWYKDIPTDGDYRYEDDKQMEKQGGFDKTEPSSDTVDSSEDKEIKEELERAFEDTQSI